jgi:hypothetical protein
MTTTANLQKMNSLRQREQNPIVHGHIAEFFMKSAQRAFRRDCKKTAVFCCGVRPQ